MLKNTIILICLLFLLPLKNLAQNEQLFSSYIFNGILINPGYAGSQECLNINVIAKKQWVGLQGAPTSMMFSAHSPTKNEKVALGLKVYNDQLGVTRQSGLSGVYSYRLKVNENTSVSAGIEAGIININSNFTSLPTKMEGDIAFAQNQNAFVADFSTGLYLQSDKYFIGFSIPHIQRNFLNDQGYGGLTLRKQYFISGGYLFSLSDKLKFRPTTLVRAIQGAKIQADLNAYLIVQDVLWLGASFRTSGAMIFLTQMQLSPQLSFGYGFDFNTNFNNAIGRTSHELILNYRFAFFNSTLSTPRYF